MGFRAFAAVVAADWVGDVGFVVRGILVDTIPAGREEDLLAETIGAVSVWEVLGLGSARGVEVDAGVGDGLAGDIVGGVALEGVAGNHAEVGWEGFHFHVFGGALEVIDQCAAILLN